MKKIFLPLLSTIAFVNAQTIQYPLFQGSFDGTVYEQTYSFPSSAQNHAGFANDNQNIYPLSFPSGGKVQFTANTPTNAEIYFRFEANPWPDVDPAQNTNTITILAANNGTENNVYQVDIPSSEFNTYNSALLYLVTRDVEVEISNIKIITYDSGGSILNTDFPLFQGSFDGTVYKQTFSFPSSAQNHAGFANDNQNIYPLSFPSGGKVQFTANTPTNAEIYFRFEANPWPDFDPAQNTNTVTILAANSGTENNVYQVDIPSSESNTYNSALLFLVTRDVEVEISNIKIITNEATSEDYVLVWGDEFENDEETYISNQINPVDPTKWFHQTYPANNGQGWYNNEEQHYTDRLDNSYVSDGTLKIKAIKGTYSNPQTGSSQNYTSARLNSKYAFNFGKVEVRAKLPSAQGTWPAIWTLGQNISEQGAYWQTQGYGTIGWPACGEIDIMEQDSDKSITSGAFHYGPNFDNWKYTTDHTSVSDTEDTWHVYSMIWTEEDISLMVDGVEFHNTSDIDFRGVGPVDMSFFQANHFILLNVAMGGMLGGSIAADFSSAVMEIDYVRVYQSQSLSTPSILKKELLLYPNPSDGSFQIESGIQIEEVHIYNLNGLKLQSFQPNKKAFTIHSNLPKGLYLADISGSNFREIKRLMVK